MQRSSVGVGRPARAAQGVGACAGACSARPGVWPSGRVVQVMTLARGVRFCPVIFREPMAVCFWGGAGAGASALLPRYFVISFHAQSVRAHASQVHWYGKVWSPYGTVHEDVRLPGFEVGGNAC